MDASQERRLLRTGMLADYLVRAGFNVVWWNSSFDHIAKVNRTNTDAQLVLDNGVMVQLMYAKGYTKNVSIRRVFNHIEVARRFACLAREYEDKPDIILSSMPTIELCVEATRYGRENHIPVALDIRDLWPDTFRDLLPRCVSPIAPLLFRGAYAKLKRACRNASAILGITDEFVGWGVGHSARPRGVFDAVFPMAYEDSTATHCNDRDQASLRRKYGLTGDEFIVCFFGTIGRQFHLDTVISAARALLSSEADVRFILCGNGECLEKYKGSASGCANVIFPGWVEKREIQKIMSIASVGLAPYVNTDNFLKNLPNKPIEYLSAGLPVLSSIRGVLGQLIRKNNCGFEYDHDSGKLVRCITDLKSSPSLLREMSKNARSLYDRDFRADVVYPAMIKHMQLIAENDG